MAIASAVVTACSSAKPTVSPPSADPPQGLDLAAAPAPPKGLCAKAHTTIEINDCLSKTLAMWNKRLDLATRQIRSELSNRRGVSSTTGYGDTLTDFDQATAAWNAYRTKIWSAAYLNSIGGTIRDAENLTCQITLTSERIALLQSTFDQH